MMKNHYFRLFLVAVVAASIGLSIQNLNLAKHFSFQDKIDYTTLVDSYDETQKTAIFNNARVQIAQAETEEKAETDQVLGEASPGEIKIKKTIAIDLTKQRLMAFENDQLRYYFIISSGKWGRTPTGLFEIWSKFRYTKMSGGSTALRTYYYLPNVPYVMFFSNAQVAGSRGFSLHGTYWHDNFGHPMSHGCVNMITQDAGKLFYWTGPDLNGKNSIRANRNNPGTKILIYGEAPIE
jgi:lipoprotein-anchoring transpeptidase ErfK/SrfK